MFLQDQPAYAVAARGRKRQAARLSGPLQRRVGLVEEAVVEPGVALGPDDQLVVLVPDSGRGYLSKIFNDEWMMDFGFIRCEGDCAGDVLATKSDAIPDLVLVTPDEPARSAWSLMRDLGVSQVVVSVSKEPPLAAKEVSGSLDELALMDRAFRDPSVLDRPVGEVMSPAMPMIGVGEPVAKVVAALDSSATLLVLDGGHPVGLLSRSDVLGFLAARGLA